MNVKLKEPEKTDQLLFNLYGNDLGKFDVNLNASARINPKWSTLLLLHSDHLGNRVDRNGDTFLDLPLATQFNAFNKWKYISGKGIVSEVGLGALRETRQGGQLDFRDTGESAYLQHYGTTQATTRYTGYAKTSYTWPSRPFQSLGLLLSGTDHAFTSAYSPAYSRAATTGPRTYDGTQRTGLGTLLFQSVLGNTAHVYRAGLSFLYDDYREVFRDGHSYPTETAADVYTKEHRNRLELVPGAFAEYTYQNSHNLTVVAGLRADHHNLYGWQVTPRLNLKYEAAKNTVLRVAAGRGFRVANPIADNASLLASARDFVINANLRPETAWNVGGSATQYFTVLGHPATAVLDYYHTEFGNQVVADMYTSPALVEIQNLGPNGRSFAHSLQGELQIEPLKGLQVKGAYKYLDVRTTYDGVLLPKPLTPAHRAFVNLAYASAFDKWRADFTVQWFGQRPLAHISSSHAHGTGEAYSPEVAPRYGLLNAQLTRAFKRLEVYAGVKNLTNYR